jgi:hypothetical protein
MAHTIRCAHDDCPAWPPERTLMAHQIATLPLDPARLADMLLDSSADANTLHQRLADQIGPRPARRLLAAAHSIAAGRLWAADKILPAHDPRLIHGGADLDWRNR